MTRLCRGLLRYRRMTVVCGSDGIVQGRSGEMDRPFREPAHLEVFDRNPRATGAGFLGVYAHGPVLIVRLEESIGPVTHVLVSSPSSLLHSAHALLIESEAV